MTVRERAVAVLETEPAWHQRGLDSLLPGIAAAITAAVAAERERVKVAAVRWFDSHDDFFQDAGPEMENDLLTTLGLT